jgi:hypothetical protein
MSLWSKHSILIIYSNSKTQCSASDKMCYEKLNYTACTKQNKNIFSMTNSYTYWDVEWKHDILRSSEHTLKQMLTSSSSLDSNIYKQVPNHMHQQIQYTFTGFMMHNVLVYSTCIFMNNSVHYTSCLNSSYQCVFQDFFFLDM